VTGTIEVEVAYAPDASEQCVLVFRVVSGCTVREALRSSGVLARYAPLRLEELTVGIYGNLVSLDEVLHHHDRVEIYRSLIADPKKARAERAKRQKRK
jgi:hypothetical protein